MSTTTQQRATLAQFIEAHGLRMTVKRTDRNPHMADDTMNHWRCTLVCQRRRMTLVFSKGAGHRGAEPGIREVLDCIASDAAGAMDTFHHWCADLGYDEDSRKAEKIYQTCKRQSASLRRLLADDAAFDALLYDTDRE